MQKYMVIERFKAGCGNAAHERFHRQGRLLPNGLYYLNSWPNKDLLICYQLMETQSPVLLDLWFERWNDFVEFDVVPIDA
ncbi:MAG: DUF3303 family protein [Rhodobacteraceae bacterium]|nr:DUF3303 family protein [Paracoccaceae bacterium]MBL6640107.1 DUF3303 family protein [Paracoccaceae bacterium]MBL6789299.1 DUF3303 family protein [Paracoccaceae bacterium]MBL6860405.1 DUF3303 family protein [Paracoccaceae bacterium]